MAKVIQNLKKDIHVPSHHTHIRMRKHRDNGDFMGLISFIEMEIRVKEQISLYYQYFNVYSQAAA
jgi:hypothetical protein